LTENFDVEVIAPGTTPKKSPGGVAFEVQIKTPEKADKHPDVRARLESYSTDCSSGDSGDSGSETAKKSNHRVRGLSECLEVAAKKQERRQAHIAVVAARAKEHVETVKTKAAAVQQRRLAQTEADKSRLETAMAQKVEVSSANVAKRSSVAGEHNKVVEDKLSKHREAAGCRQETEKSRLEAVMAQKVEVGSANVAQRRSLAAQHNKIVHDKVHKHKEAAHVRQQKIMERHEKKRGSKIVGVPYSCVRDVPVATAAAPSLENA